MTEHAPTIPISAYLGYLASEEPPSECYGCDPHLVGDFVEIAKTVA
jgi:hypothetical protein